MKIFREVFFIVLGALAVAGIVGFVLTAHPPKTANPGRGQQPPEEEQEGRIDQRPLEMARALAAVASTPEEQQLAQDAARAADREVDLAFASALRAASQQPPPKREQAIEERVRKAQNEIKESQARIKQLTAKSAEAQGKSSLAPQVAFAQARLDLAQNELADAQEDQARAGGGAYGQIERLWQEHQATEHANGATRPSPVSFQASSELSARSLISRWGAWSGLATKSVEVAQAQEYVLNQRALLTRQHDALEEQVASVESQQPPPPAIGGRKAAREKPSEPSNQVTPASLSTLRQLSQDESNLASLDQRIQDLGSLAILYAQWTSLVSVRSRAALHRLIRSALWVILTLLVVSLICRLIDRFFDRINLERKQRMTLRGVLRFIVQALGALVILLVVFGSPSHMSTVIGLVGAGMAVALKDFVVAFCGWFVLMGRNGVRVGDWVEISGVRGEVVEIGLLRTVLLETGNWTEAGHPTGRQVAFLNSYAVEGYYFNFSTSSQWMWDEMPVLIPSHDDPYPTIEKIQDLVVKETQENTRKAEEEWQRVAQRCGAKSFSVEPDINVKPIETGVQLIVRYIVRASERYEVRFRLSHAIVKLLHPSESPPAAGLLAEATGPEIPPMEADAASTFAKP